MAHSQQMRRFLDGVHETSLLHTALRERGLVPRPMRLCNQVPRAYQEVAIAAVLQAPSHSSVCVLPTGSGKTLVGVGVVVRDCERLFASRIAGRFLVVTNSHTSARQWKHMLVSCSTLQEHDVAIVDGRETDLLRAQLAHVNVATVAMLSMQRPNCTVQYLREQHFHRCILDECHMIPADKYSVVLRWDVTSWLALTASPLRADGNFKQLTERIGDEMTPVSWRQLEREGYIAPLLLTLIPCTLPAGWAQHYHGATEETRRRLDLFNPRKLLLLERLLHHWRHAPRDAADGANGEPRVVMIFVDTLELLDELARSLGLPSVKGSTPIDERERLFDALRRGEIDELLVSRCGDTAVDVPRVSRIVQLDALEGSQRQLVQRAGRAMRTHPDKRSAQVFDVHTRGSRSADLALVRMEFLLEQGYSFTTMSHATQATYGDYEPHADGTRWVYADWSKQDRMLQSILSYEQRLSDSRGEVARLSDEVRRVGREATRARARLHDAMREQRAGGRAAPMQSAFSRRRAQHTRALGRQRAQLRVQLEAAAPSVLGE